MQCNPQGPVGKPQQRLQGRQRERSQGSPHSWPATPRASRRHPLLAWFALALATVVAVPALAAPIGTAFTYQGVLKDSSLPANGSFSFVFRLHDDEFAGSQVGSDVNLSGVSVTDGLFTVELDFGAVFDGTELWLEIEVDSQVLSPRQRLSATPYALHAATADVEIFSAIEVPSGSNPVADGSLDTLRLTAGGIVTITGDAVTDTVNISAVELDGSPTNELQNLFGTIAGDSGSTTADDQVDTLTVAGGSGITTSVSGDTLTIAASGDSGVRVTAVDGLPSQGDCSSANEGELLYGRDFEALFVCVGTGWQISALSEYLPPFGSNGSAPGQFSRPTGVDIDTSDRIVVADRINHRIQVFDSSGDFLFTFGGLGSGNGQFDLPIGIATDPANRILVADTDNHRIQVFNAAGSFQFSFGSEGSGNGQFSFPRHLTGDSPGRIIVADSNNHRIQVFDSSGGFLFRFGSNGSANGQFVDPRGIAVDGSGRIIVADRGNSRVQIFASSGAFIAKFGSSGSGPGQFNFLRGLATDGSGRILVADSNNDRIQVFDGSGTFVSAFGSAGNNTGRFESPQDIAINGLGSIVVADTNNDRIQIRLYP